MGSGQLGGRCATPPCHTPGTRYRSSQQPECHTTNAQLGDDTLPDTQPADDAWTEPMWLALHHVLMEVSPSVCADTSPTASGMYDGSYALMIADASVAC